MRLFVIGDYKSETGPANVTKELIAALPGDTLFLKSMNKAVRLIELYIKVPKSDACVISGHSKQNLIAIRLAKKYGKKVVFLMHGCVEYENEINGVPDESMNQVERKTLEGADLILAVSRQFERWLKDYYKEYAAKISHLTNGIDFSVLTDNNKDKIKGDGSVANPYRLMSIGGGMPRKRIIRICEAVEILKNKGIYCKLVIAGDKGADSGRIRAYDFVWDMGIIKHEKALKELFKAQVYIQNSCFETFGLAPLEALVNGCDLLLSKEVGAISVFDSGVISENDIIMNCEDSYEIAQKLEIILRNSNHDRLMSGLYKDKRTYSAVAARLMRICDEII